MFVVITYLTTRYWTGYASQFALNGDILHFYIGGGYDIGQVVAYKQQYLRKISNI